MRTISTIVAAALGLLLFGCGGDTGTSGFTQLRAISAVSVPNQIDVFSDFNTIGANLSNGAASGYSSHPAGTLNLGMRQSGTTQTILTGSMTGLLNQRHTIIPHQTGTNSWAMIALVDDAAPAPVTKFRLRLVHVERFEGDVDVYFVEPGADLSTEVPIVTDLPFQTSTGYIELDAGDPMEIRITRANTLEEIGNIVAFTPPGASARTLMIFDDAGTRLQLYTD